MHPFRLNLTVAAVLLGSFAAPLMAKDFGDVLSDIVREASSHYQSPPHYSNPGGYSPYTPPPLKADPVARNQHAFDVGYRVGQDDFHQHHSKRFSRHPDLFDRATQDAFASGYERGFDTAKQAASRGRNPYTPPRTSPRHAESALYPSGYYPYSPPPQGADRETRNRHSYDVGYRVGQDDFHHGHSKQFMRHKDLYDRSTQRNFALGYEHGYDKARALERPSVDPGPRPALVAAVGQGTVTIKDRGRVVCSIRTAAPNVEKYQFTEGQRGIVVKSRGNHGPATVELFDTHTGVLRDKVLAFAIKNGRPEWARGMQD